MRLKGLHYPEPSVKGGNPGGPVIDLSDQVRIRLIVLVSNFQAKLEDRIDEKLLNGFKCSELAGDSARRVVRLACALGIIQKPLHDNLVFLIKRRNEAAHNRPVQLEYSDFPQFDKMLPKNVVTKLHSRSDTRDGHYVALLEAIDEHLAI